MPSQEIIALICTFLTALLGTGGVLFYLHKQNAPFRTNVVQILGFIWFIPLVSFLALQNRIDQNTLSALLGAFVGYIFGKTSLKEEWGGKD